MIIRKDKDHGLGLCTSCIYLRAHIDRAFAFRCEKYGIIGDKKCDKYEEFVPYEKQEEAT
jgi:hypothetical protein